MTSDGKMMEAENVRKEGDARQRAQEERRRRGGRAGLRGGRPKERMGPVRSVGKLVWRGQTGEERWRRSGGGRGGGGDGRWWWTLR